MNKSYQGDRTFQGRGALEQRLSFPTNLAFEPVQLCNAACFCCPYTWLKEDEAYRGKTMSREQIDSLLRDFASCRMKYGYEGRLRINPFRYSDPLVCKDLNFILELCRELEIQCAITTNAVSFTNSNVEILDHFFDVLGKVSISVIGSSVAEVRELMNVDLDRTFRLLQAAIERAPRLRKKIRVNLRKMTGAVDEAKRLAILSQRFQGILKREPYIREVTWLSNRVNKQIDTFPHDMHSKPQILSRAGQAEERFLIGCPKNILERMEVMCDGEVVLCCDDAEKTKTYGNVFSEGIDAIWNGSLLEEHSLLFRSSYGIDKDELICTTCSRAQWSNGDGGESLDID